jgi:hypothetical protein
VVFWTPLSSMMSTLIWEDAGAEHAVGDHRRGAVDFFLGAGAGRADQQHTCHRQQHRQHPVPPEAHRPLRHQSSPVL